MILQLRFRVQEEALQFEAHNPKDSQSHSVFCLSFCNGQYLGEARSASSNPYDCLKSSARNVPKDICLYCTDITTAVVYLCLLPQGFIEDKSDPKTREGAVQAFECLCDKLGKLFEPYVISILPLILTCFGDTALPVREATVDAARAMMRNLSAQGDSKVHIEVFQDAS